MGIYIMQPIVQIIEYRAENNGSLTNVCVVGFGVVFVDC